MKRDQKWSLFFCPATGLENNFYGIYRHVSDRACKNSRVYKYPPPGSSGSVFMASKKYPLPILNIYC